MIDAHIHTQFSVDSSIKLEDLTRISLKRNIDIIGISDHLDFDPRDQSYGKYNFYSIKNGVTPFMEKGNFSFLLGAEITFQKKYLKKIKNFLENTPIDFCIGSLHYINGTLISKWVTENEEKGFLPYFETLLDMVSSGMFDIVGHFDYFKKYLSNSSFYNEDDYREIITEIFDIMIKKDIVLEINTSGWRYFYFSPFPSLSLIKLYKERGGKLLSLGSDAHRWYEIGYRIEYVVDLMKQMGYSFLIYFKKRKMQELPI